MKKENHNKTKTDKKRSHRLNRFEFTFVCIFAICILAGGGWGTFHLLTSTTAAASGMKSMNGMNGMSGMKGMSGMNMSGQKSSSTSGWYQDPKHPWVIAPKPGPSPVSGKPMVPLDPKKFASNILVDPATVQNIGIQTTKAKTGPVIQHVRAVGTVKYDQTRLYAVNMKVGGWIKNLYVDSVGQVVHKGDPLFELNSPKLYSAKQKFLISLQAAEDGGVRMAPNSVQGKLLAAAKAKLKFLGLNSAQIKALARRGKATRVTTFYSPFSGVVIKKQVIQGRHITPGTLAYKIADLSKVWVIASVYESQLGKVHAGQTATMKLTYLPGKIFTGKVQYVYPYLDAEAHEAKLRLVFNNPNNILKPGMFAQVSLINRATKKATLVPQRAVVLTGDKKLVFVKTRRGRFEPRQVITGATTGKGWIAIKKGVKPGEKVVTSGEFLLGSEAAIHAAKARMIMGEGSSMSGMNMGGMNMGGMKMGGN